jgi:hypothetical protein
MSDTTQLTNRGTARVDAPVESQCANCRWFMILHATNPAGSFRGTCHRYDYVSTEKTPLVRADDWCFEHRLNLALGFATRVDQRRPRSNH